MKLTLEKAKELMDESGGNLDLRCTAITQLPDGLTVGGKLCLEDTPITALPEGLTVGGSLYLEDTQITQLPDDLTVGGYLDLRGTEITDTNKYKRLENGDYLAGRYLYADGILTHVKRRRTVGEHTYYIGKIKGENVVSDGKHYAHCDKLRDGISDLLFKSAAERGAEQYGHLTAESVLPFEEAVSMYRIITGACRQGTQSFIDGLKERKDAYAVSEILEMTRGQYGAERLCEFFA